MRRLASSLSPGAALTGAALLFVGAVATEARPSSQIPASHTPNYVVSATIRDIMAAIVDGAADDVWNAVVVTAGPEGVVTKVPQNDEEWLVARRGALAVIEAANLLVMPGRRVANPGEGSLAPGDELHPDEIAQLIAKDPRAWSNMVYGLRNVMTQAVKAIDARDTEELFALGEKIEVACESCHTKFWYPNQRLPPGYGTSGRSQ